LREGGLFCNLDVLYGGLGIGKLKFLIQIIIFPAVNFFHFLVIKILDPNSIRIRIGIHYSTLKCLIRMRIRINEYGSETLSPDKRPLYLRRSLLLLLCAVHVILHFVFALLPLAVTLHLLLLALSLRRVVLPDSYK